MSFPILVPLRIEVRRSPKEIETIDFWCQVYLERVYATAFFCPDRGFIWARKWPVIGEFDPWHPSGPMKWYAEIERFGEPLLSPQELDRFLENREELSRLQQEFLLNEYASHRDFYTNNSYINEPSLAS